MGAQGQAVGSRRSACPGRPGSTSLVQPQHCRPGSSAGQRGQAGAGEGFFWDGKGQFGARIQTACPPCQQRARGGVFPCAERA